MAIATIEEAIEDIRRGRMVVLMDDKNRENEGDLCMAAEKATPDAINFMARFGRGLICLTLTEERVRHLGLHMMVSENTSPFGTAFTVSIDAAENVTTGISAADRAHTILASVADAAVPEAAACWSAPGRPRAPWTWRAWPGSSLPASSARS